jgi:hypothetical protein
MNSLRPGVWMILVATAFVVLLPMTLRAAGRCFSRSDLEGMQKSELIDIILKRQDSQGGQWVETSYNPLKDETGSVLNRLNHSGYNDDGSLKWPNEKLFMRRHTGFQDDYQTYYPNGERIVLRHNGFTDDHTIYWPNGKIMCRGHHGYNDHGTVYRPDGSVWLLRHDGYTDDNQRTGPPTERFTDDQMTVTAMLTADNTVKALLQVQGDGWKVRVSYGGLDGQVRVSESLYQLHGAPDAIGLLGVVGPAIR